MKKRRLQLPQSPPSSVVAPLAVSMQEAAAMAGIGRTSMWRLLSMQIIPSARIGKRRVVLIEDLRRWLESQREGQVTP